METLSLIRRKRGAMCADQRTNQIVIRELNLLPFPELHWITQPSNLRKLRAMGYRFNYLTKGTKDYDKRLLTAFKGRRLSEYDGWNGSHRIIRISKVKVLDSYAVFVDSSDHGIIRTVRVPLDKVDELLATGEARKFEEIDHCSVIMTFNLIDE